MKLAIASDDKISVTGHIGRVKGFIVLTVDDGKIISKEYRQNLFTHHGRKNNTADETQEHGHHGESHKHGHEKLAEGLNDCSNLICHGAGWRVVEDLKKSGVEVIFTSETNAEMAAVKFEKGELEIKENGACNAH